MFLLWWIRPQDDDDAPQCWHIKEDTDELKFRLKLKLNILDFEQDEDEDEDDEQNENDKLQSRMKGFVEAKVKDERIYWWRVSLKK